MSETLEQNNGMKCTGMGMPGAGLSSDWLKIIALVTMAIDHTGSVLFPMQPIWRMAGRIAFPIFAWLLVQGFVHTSNRRRYIGNMAVFALLSEIPFDLALGRRLSTDWQNVYFTLLLGLLVMSALEKLEGLPAQAVLVASAMAAAQWLHFDYGCSGQALIVVFYFYVRRRNPSLEVGFILFLLTWLLKPILRGQPVWEPYTWRNALANMELEFWGILAIPLLRQYNGVRKWKRGKYFFYLFYPLHLLILYAIVRIKIQYFT